MLRVELKDMCWYGNKLPNTRLVTYEYNILLIFVITFSAAGRLLATRLSHLPLFTTSLAVLTCTLNCCQVV
jgi:hypothetical protein